MATQQVPSGVGASDVSTRGPLLQVKSLTVAYGPVVAVRDVSLEVGHGEVVAILGANGAGKSTVLKSIVGLVAPKAGEIVFRGDSLVGKATDKVVRSGVTLCPEGRRIFGSLTVADNLRLGAASRKDAEAPEDSVWLSVFPVLKSRLGQRAGSLSGGEQQQLAIVRALMCQPEMLLLDEPSLGLAPQMVDAVFEGIASLRDSGMTILIVEQNAGLALELSDRAYVMATGSVELSGESEALLASSGVERAYLGLVGEGG